VEINSTRIVTMAAAPALNELRTREYSTAREFELLRPDLLEWSENDAKGAIVGVWCAERMVATMRALVVADRPTAEDLMTCSVDLDASHFPALVLGRGATAQSHRGLGLNSLLRVHFLRACLDEGGTLPGELPVASALGLAYEGAPRLRLMRELGYALHQPEHVWDPEAREVTPALLAVLPRASFPSALARLAALAAPLERDFPWSGPRLRMPRALAAVAPRPVPAEPSR
jgi:GNAT superfamily N-acetyltransferase